MNKGRVQKRGIHLKWRTSCPSADSVEDSWSHNINQRYGSAAVQELASVLRETKRYGKTWKRGDGEQGIRDLVLYEQACRNGHGAYESARLDEVNTEPVEDKRVVKLRRQTVEHRRREDLHRSRLQRSLDGRKIHLPRTITKKAMLKFPSFNP